MTATARLALSTALLLGTATLATAAYAAPAIGLVGGTTLVMFDTEQKGLSGVLVNNKKQAVRCMGQETPQLQQ